MGICVKCKYYEEIEREFQCVLPEYPVNEKSLINKTIVSKMHYDNKEIVGVCNNPKHTKTDFISGESLEKDVELFNEFGQCELFVDIDGEEPLDVPEYPKLQLVAEKTEIEIEEELGIKCYASIKKDGKLSYKWFVNEEESEDKNDEDYSFNFVSEEAGEYTIKCEVKNTDESCKDRQTSTSYLELKIVVKEAEEESGEDEPSDEEPTEPTEPSEEETEEPSDEFVPSSPDSEYF